MRLTCGFGNFVRLSRTYRAPLIGYYQRLLDQALRDRDAYQVLQIQNDLDNVRSQYQADAKSEKQRYKNEVVKIRAAYCQ